MMPRVLRIINRFNLGGPTYNAAYLTKYMEGDFETLLVGGMKDDTEDSSEFILENIGLKAQMLPEMRRSINPWRDYQAYRRLKAIIAQYKPDVVHTHASKPGALGRYAAYRMGVPVIIHTFHGHVFHSYFGRATTLFYKFLERRLASISTCIIAISEGQKNELSEVHSICAPDKIAVVPLGFDLSRFRDSEGTMRPVMRQKYNLDDDCVAISIVGRLVPVKNHELFIKSLSYLKQHTKKPFKGFVVGDGELRTQTEQHCEKYGLKYSAGQDTDADVYFTSWVKEVEYVYAASDVVALTSWNEGTPVSLIEAQAAGKAIVSTRVGGIEDVVLPGQTALLSDSGNDAHFCQNMLKLVEDEDLRRDFSSKGWNFVKDKFHFERLAADMAKLYTRLLA